MRMLLAGLMVVVAGGLVRGGQDDDEPVKYKNKEGKYAIAFPAGAKVKTMKQDAGGGLTMHTAAVESGGNAYAVMYADFPDAVKDVDPAILFDGAQKGAVGEGKGKLVGRPKDITVGAKKYPGRDIVVDKDGTKLKTRMVLAGSRMYIIIVGGADDFATSKDAQKFLDSFEVTR